MSNIILTNVALSIVTDSVARCWTTALAERNESKVDYGTYVKDMAVTNDSLPAHVKVFREAFKAAHKRATGSEIKAYATKVRNGLSYHLPEKMINAAITLRVSLSGDGGGTTVVATDHPLYESIKALVAGVTV